MLFQVLDKKKGIPITLAVVYISVARRLGVMCEPVSFPIHFLIRWQEYPQYVQMLIFSYCGFWVGVVFFAELWNT